MQSTQSTQSQRTKTSVTLSDYKTLYPSGRFKTVGHIENSIKILQQAKLLLTNPEDDTDDDYNRSPYVCDVVANSSKLLFKDRFTTEAEDIRDWIKELIEGQFSVITWMGDKYGLHRTFDKNAKAIRLAWIDWMISELEQKKRYIQDIWRFQQAA